LWIFERFTQNEWVFQGSLKISLPGKARLSLYSFFVLGFLVWGRLIKSPFETFDGGCIVAKIIRNYGPISAEIRW
jgi:hypothetical protein